MLIKNNEELRSYIPNSFGTTVPTQANLYDKMRPFLSMAEHWLTSVFIEIGILKDIENSITDEEHPLYFLPRRVITLRAWQHALPALDILVTNNGIGAAETNTIKPASKAKIDRLLETTGEELDNALRAMIKILRSREDWLDSPLSAPLRLTLFPDYDLIDLLHLPLPERRGDKTIHNLFISLLPKVIKVEKHISRYWISLPVHRRLLRLMEQPEVLHSGNHGTEQLLINMIQNAVVEILNTKCECRLSDPHLHKTFQELSNFVIDNPDVFPEWEGSETQELFQMKRFKNHHGSCGHWL